MLSLMRFISTKCILGLFVFILSCSTADYPEIYSYKFNFVRSNKEPIIFKSKKKIAIQTFVDERKNENISYMPMLYIPFMPYASNFFNKSENTFYYRLIFLPEIDLAKAMESELVDYNVFDKIFYTDRTNPKDADFLISCKLKKNQIYSKQTIYGTGAFVFLKEWPLPYLWLALITDFFTIKTEFELELKEIKTNQVVLRKTFTKEESDWEITVTSNEKVVNRFVLLNQKVVQEMSKEIIQYFEENKK